MADCPNLVNNSIFRHIITGKNTGSNPLAGTNRSFQSFHAQLICFGFIVPKLNFTECISEPFVSEIFVRLYCVNEFVPINSISNQVIK